MSTPPSQQLIEEPTASADAFEHHHYHHQKTENAAEIPVVATVAAAATTTRSRTASSASTNTTTAMGSKRMVGAIIRTGRRSSFLGNHLMFTRSSPSLFHAIVVIFLEFFAWGLLTLPAINVLNVTFPERTFLMNGLIMGIKGFLSFLSAPLIGALSDVWGRKFFLLITVFFTCLPIPFLKFSPSIYFGLLVVSGIFSVTFSVIFAYVADITEEHQRSYAYGWVTATFALSLITSPALGAFISATFNGDNLVIMLATAVAIFDFIYILFFVPESLPEKLRQKSVSIWESADPFSSLRKAGKDTMILTLCGAVLLSYLPEAGQYSCFFVYLKLVIGFNQVQVAAYIALIGVMSVIAQTVLLSMLMTRLGSKNTIMIGLIFEMLQLICFGLGSSHWVVWSAGVIAAIGTITYPAISAYVSTYADADKQGLVQGIITGIRGLCNGLGPCFFGFIFSLFNVDLVRQSETVDAGSASLRHMMPSIDRNGSGSNFINFLNSTTNQFFHSPTEQVIPGPPFLFGALLVLLAILVMAFIPELVQYPPSAGGGYGDAFLSPAYKSSRIMSPNKSSHQSSSNYYYKNMQHQTLKDTQCAIEKQSPGSEFDDVKMLNDTQKYDDILMIDEDEEDFGDIERPEASSSSSSENDSDIDSTKRRLLNASSLSEMPAEPGSIKHQGGQPVPITPPNVHHTIVMSTSNHRTTSTTIHRPGPPPLPSSTLMAIEETKPNNGKMGVIFDKVPLPPPPKINNKHLSQTPPLVRHHFDGGEKFGSGRSPSRNGSLSLTSLSPLNSNINGVPNIQQHSEKPRLTSSIVQQQTVQT